MDWLQLILLCGAGFMAWTLNTLSAGGGGLMLIPAVTFLTGSAAVAPVITITELMGNPARILAFRRDVDWHIVRWYLPGAIIGAAAGAWLFASARADWLQIFIGLYLIGAVWEFRGGARARSYQARRWWFLPAGLIVSLLSALMGTVGPVLNSLYLNYGSSKETLVATKSVNSFATDVVKIAVFADLGAFGGHALAFGLATGIGAALSTVAAQPWLGRMSGRQFRTAVVMLMALSGVLMIWKQNEVIIALYHHLAGGL
ncbi:sulfite exporter TauE/SafE family protein [Mesorhizobium sp. Cs1299R1N3]|uniref:sulfite exporter TauE/SafE family protein n=1 Tax=Mesorhizobium sp. Cs1299R1N3 TaxID=3015173 RepID=UPI00301D3C05